MSDDIKHECGIAMIRLRKPLDYYFNKYGSVMYALNKMYLLMEKQHNRGQDGAGLAAIRLNMPPGCSYIGLERSISINPIQDIFQRINAEVNVLARDRGNSTEPLSDWYKKNVRFAAELMLGHLRYGTFGKNDINCCHPFVRANNWMTKTLVVAGNFNLTNTPQLFNLLLDIGQHPIDRADTVTILEKIGHYLDEENEFLYQKFKEEGHSKREISSLIAKEMNLQKIIQDACLKWDGGYVVAGMFGHGDAFVARDPNGIRPAFWYANDEIIVVASERPAIQTAFKAPIEEIQEVPPGSTLIIKKDATFEITPFTNPKPIKQCSFERIYFSRGTDANIYQERKLLGKFLTPTILNAINHDYVNTVFSFIPNTAETCFFGLMEELRHYCDDERRERFMKAQEENQKLTPAFFDELMGFRPRFEKVAVKDAKLRTFITADKQRNDLVAHVYDITYQSLIPGKDTLVIIDDSIVRGTTLKESIFRILDRLGPRKIIIVSSAPQIRYPDCYGIDMAKLGDFVAFSAAIELIKENHMNHLIEDVYQECKHQLTLPDEQQINAVKAIYAPFTVDQLSEKISLLLTPIDIEAETQILYQSIENLHLACPNHTGDWYFSGDYPTPGGNRVCNQSYVNFIEGRNERAY